MTGNSTAGLNSQGGGLYTASGSNTPVLTNTIVANNSATGSNGEDLYVDGTPFETSFSLIENAPSTTVDETVAGSNILGTDPGSAPWP